jgi:23S rRNA G2445 N2-methylase RlmL
MDRLLATCARGTEAALARELHQLGFAGVKRAHGGVSFAVEEPLTGGLRACLELRTALRVLMPIATFPAASDETLYQGAMGVAWEDWLTPRHTFAVAATSRAAPPLANTAHVALRVKDAIADRLRDRSGARPDVSKDDPDVRVYVHIESAARSRGGQPAVTVGLDLAGDSLHARGYRVAQVAAPLRETMAASVLLLGGWEGRRPLHDPCCGSGTIVIEAALLATGRAPGRAGKRPPLGVTRWPRFDDRARKTLAELEAAADARVKPTLDLALVGSDRDPAAIEAARRNAEAAGVGHVIRWHVADARALEPLTPPGDIVTNPPYGERLEGKQGGLEGFFRAFGQRLRTLDGHRGLVLAPADVQRWLGLRPSWQTPLMNGPIEVSLARFELGRR